jgi:hypothetical protein
VLATVGDPAVPDLDHNAAANVQVLAVPLSAVVMNADHAAVIALEQVLQCGLKGPSRPTHVSAELRKGRLPAAVVASEGASPRRVL